MLIEARESKEISEKETKISSSMKISSNISSRESRVKDAVESMLMASNTIDPMNLTKPDPSVRKLEPCPQLDLDIRLTSKDDFLVGIQGTVSEQIRLDEESRNSNHNSSLNSEHAQALKTSPSKAMSIMSTEASSIRSSGLYKKSGLSVKDPGQTSWQSYKNTYIDFQRWRQQQSMTNHRNSLMSLEDVSSHSPVIKVSPRLTSSSLSLPKQSPLHKKHLMGNKRNVPQSVILPKSSRLPSHMVVATTEEASQIDSWLNLIHDDAVAATFLENAGKEKSILPSSTTLFQSRERYGKQSMDEISDYNFESAAKKMTEELLEDNSQEIISGPTLRRATLALSNLKINVNSGDEDDYNDNNDSDGKVSPTSAISLSSKKSDKRFSLLKTSIQRVKDSIKVLHGKKLLPDSFLSALNFHKKDRAESPASLKRRSRSEEGINHNDSKKNWWRALQNHLVKK